MRPLLFLGNRRSGTTLMTHIVNTHPKIYVSYERYVIWLLYQCKEYGTTNFKLYPGMGTMMPIDNTIHHAGYIFEKLVRGEINRDTLRAAFYSASVQNMSVRKGGKGRKVDWIGEKNPETADPAMWEFAHWLLPEAKYIHMVRHPVGVARSKRWIVENWEKKAWPPSWESDIGELLRLWLVREQYVQRIIESGIPVVTVRLEDVWEDPGEEFNRVFDFLGLERSGGWHTHDDWLKPHGQSRGQEEYDLTMRWNIPGLGEMMERYRYD